MLYPRQNMLEAVKCPSGQRIFLKILWKKSQLRSKYLKNNNEENRKLHT